MKKIINWIMLVGVLGLGFFLSYCLIPNWIPEGTFIYPAKQKMFGPSVVNAQGSQTIYATPLNQVIALGASAIITNIGQSNHLINALVENGVAPCVALPTGWYIAIEGSFDGTNYRAIGAPITLVYQLSSGKLIGQTYGYGAYPFIRVNYASQGGSTVLANCKLTVTYSGTIPSTTTASFLNSLSTNYQYTPNVAITDASFASITSLTTQNVGKVTLYALNVSNTSSGAATITFRVHYSGGDATLFVFKLLASQNLTWQLTGVPWWADVSPGGRLQAQMDTGNTANVYVAYRVE